MSEYFPEPKSSGRRMKVELDLSNYATKANLKNVADVNTSKFDKKFDIASLKSNLDKLDIDRLKSVPTNWSHLKNKVGNLDVDKLVSVSVDLSQLSDVVKNDSVKRDVYNAMIKNIEDKIPDITNLATNTALHAKINEVKNEMPNITNLASTTALSAVENKIPNVNNLVKKLTIRKELMKLKKKLLLIMTMINILLLKNLFI